MGSCGGAAGGISGVQPPGLLGYGLGPKDIAKKIAVLRGGKNLKNLLPVRSATQLLFSYNVLI